MQPKDKTTIEIYEDVLSGSVAIAEVKRRLSLVATSEEVYVTPSVVERILEKYLADKVGSQQLSDWAAFLVSNDAYVTRGWEDDSVADKYEPMWHILQQLAAPFIDGTVTKDRVRGLLETLSMIERD